MTHSKNSHLLMDTVSTVRYVKSGKFWRVSDSIFKSPLLFLGCVSNYDLKKRCVRQQNSDHQKNFGHFSDNAFLSGDMNDRTGRKGSGYPE